MSSALTYESFRGPPTVGQTSAQVAADRRRRTGGVDDGEKTPTNDDDEVDSEAEASPRHSRRPDHDVIVTTSSPRPLTGCETAFVPSPRVSTTSSPTTQTLLVSRAPTVHRPSPSQCQPSSSSVTSPASPRPRPQIAPKPRLDVRRRRTSAGESTTDNDDHYHGGPSPASRHHDAGSGSSSPPPPSTTTSPGIAMLASVMAAASSQRMSERCRQPGQSPSSSTGRRTGAADDVKNSAVPAVSTCARPSSASALLRTAATVVVNGSPGNSASSQTPRTHSVTGTSSSTSVGSGAAKKLPTGTDDQSVSLARTSTSPVESPRRASSSAAVSPPVPPKHPPNQSSSPVKHHPDAAVPPSLVSSPSSLSSSGSAASVRRLGCVGNPPPAPGETSTLPFANENVGTIRQRGNVLASSELPAASLTSVNDGVATTSGMLRSPLLHILVRSKQKYSNKQTLSFAIQLLPSIFFVCSLLTSSLQRIRNVCAFVVCNVCVVCSTDCLHDQSLISIWILLKIPPEEILQDSLAVIAIRIDNGE